MQQLKNGERDHGYGKTDRAAQGHVGEWFFCDGVGVVAHGRVKTSGVFSSMIALLSFFCKNIIS